VQLRTAYIQKIVKPFGVYHLVLVKLKQAYDGGKGASYIMGYDADHAALGFGYTLQLLVL
jgi:hypothetical protein